MIESVDCFVGVSRMQSVDDSFVGFSCLKSSYLKKLMNVLSITTPSQYSSADSLSFSLQSDEWHSSPANLFLMTSVNDGTLSTINNSGNSQ